MSLINFSSTRKMRHICDEGQTIDNETCEHHPALMLYVGFVADIIYREHLPRYD